MHLKDELWDTLKKVKGGAILPGNGDAVAAQAREILRTVRTQMAIFAQAGIPISTEVIDFASPPSRRR